MTKIKAKIPTLLKKLPVQSKELSRAETSVADQGRVFKVKRLLEIEDGHQLVELDYNAGTWWIFLDHWDIKGQDKPPSPPKPTPINWNNPDQKISKYFAVWEVTKRQSARVPINLEHINNILKIAKELDIIREAWGSGITVTSWYRPPAINRAAGGARNSTHIRGYAVDIAPVNGKLAEFQAFLNKGWYGALGLGLKKGFVHLDMRNGKGWQTGGSRGPRWNY